MPEESEIIKDPELIRFFSDYVGISNGKELDAHLLKIQARLEEDGTPYRCIQRLYFAFPRLSYRFFYRRILDAGKNAALSLLIEIGCCTGTDLRMMVWNGFPADRLVGLDISRHYIDCGYDMFRDRDRCNIRFVVDDFLNGSFSKDFHRRAAVVCTQSVIHLLPSNEHLHQFCKRVTEVLLPGGLFAGAHRATEHDAQIYRPFKGRWQWSIGVDTFRAALEAHHFADIEIQLETVKPDADEEHLETDQNRYWLSFCAVYRPPHDPETMNQSS